LEPSAKSADRVLSKGRREFGGAETGTRRRREKGRNEAAGEEKE